jgi:hypothetical protein
MFGRVISANIFAGQAVRVGLFFGYFIDRAMRAFPECRLSNGIRAMTARSRRPAISYIASLPAWRCANASSRKRELVETFETK